MIYTFARILLANGLFFFLVLSCSCDDGCKCDDAGPQPIIDAGLQPITDAGEDGEDGEIETDAAEENGDNNSSREADPVVITGDNLGPLLGRDPAKLVAFRYRERWERIPVQVDERVMTDLADVYGYTAIRSHQIPPEVTVVPCYADPKTFTGPDTDPAVDGDDEVVFMYRDSGTKPALFEEPQGVQKGSGIEVSLSEAGDNSEVRYVYLFTNNGSLIPDSENEYGRYDFLLKAGDYPTDYGFASGPNPENSWFTSEYYERRFPDRWHSDVLKIRTPGSNGVDILDAHFTSAEDLGECGQGTSVGMASWEGAFVTNKSGPIRSIRSYIGARSAACTQRTHVFYQKREDIIDNVRVHTIGDLLDVFDYSKEAVGMKYYNASNREGLTIDGVNDPFTNSTISANELSSDNGWTLVTGPQGSLVTVNTVDTNIAGLQFELLYRDDASPTQPCVGDESYYGINGVKLINVPCVESFCPNYLTRDRTMYYLAPETTVTDAERLARNVYTPLRVEVTLMGSDQIPSDAGDSGDIITDGGISNENDANIFDYQMCEQTNSIDKNGDDLDDERMIFRLEGGGTAIVEEWDNEADGVVDARWTWVYQDRDRLVTQQYDDGADGTVDAIRITTSDCAVSSNSEIAIMMHWICDVTRSETDVDGDGTIDEVWQVEYSDGEVVAESLDENGDGVIDQRWEIETDASGDLVIASWDRDGDGVFDETISQGERDDDSSSLEWDRDGDGQVDEIIYEYDDRVERYQGESKIAEESCVEIENERDEEGPARRQCEWDENGDGVPETTLYHDEGVWEEDELPAGTVVRQVTTDEWIREDGEVAHEVITTTTGGTTDDLYTKTAWDTDADGEDDLVCIAPDSKSPSVGVECYTDGDLIADWRLTRTDPAVEACKPALESHVRAWVSALPEKPQDYQPRSGLSDSDRYTSEIEKQFERIRGIGTFQPEDLDW